VKDRLDVVVIGDGAAGIAAAFAASRAGARTLVLSRGSGATSLYSGCLDRAAWDAHRLRPSSPHSDEAAFLDAVGIWTLGEHEARVATLAGVVRTADGRDRALLDLACCEKSCVLVPRVDRPGWDVDLLVQSWSEDAWCQDHGVRFEAIDAPLFDGDRMRCASDVEVASHLDEPEHRDAFVEALQACVRRHGGGGAVLVGPWLGVRSDVAAMLTDRIGIQTGETATLLGGTAGARWENASEALLDRLGVRRVRGRAVRLVRSKECWEIRVFDGEDAIMARAVVLASGGVVGGGIVLSSAEEAAAEEVPPAPTLPFSLSFHGPMELAVDGRVTEAVASLQGINLERFAWPRGSRDRWLLDRVGILREGASVLDASGEALPGMFAAGELASDEAAAMLPSMATGLDAGIAAAAFAAG
jgi:glycerol-3-phosphate dehydrogenase subunit B